MQDRRGIMIVMLVLTVLLLPCRNIAGALDLTVILPGDQTLRVSAAPEETVQRVKEKVYAMSEVNPLNQVVYYEGNRLEDDRTLSSYNIGEGDTLRVEHGVLNAPTSKEKSGMVWILLTILVILGVGIFFMRKKPSREYDGR
ncbi:MAG: ubiquitin-like domain-containing protein [Candidatus Latescibacterota bacterium]